MVPNLSFLKKKAKKAGSYALQQLQEEIRRDADAARGASLSAPTAAPKSAAEETESDDELLQKTGKTTADAPAVAVALPEKKRKKRLRISASGEPTGKSIRFDENGEALPDTRGVVELQDVQGELGEAAEQERVRDAQQQLEENEEKDRLREKQRVRRRKKRRMEMSLGRAIMTTMKLMTMMTMTMTMTATMTPTARRTRRTRKKKRRKAWKKRNKLQRVCGTNNPLSQGLVYAASISSPPSVSGTSRIYKTLLHLWAKNEQARLPNQHISQKGGALSINVFFAAGKLGF